MGSNPSASAARVQDRARCVKCVAWRALHAEESRRSRSSLPSATLNRQALAAPCSIQYQRTQAPLHKHKHTRARTPPRFGRRLRLAKYPQTHTHSHTHTRAGNGLTGMAHDSTSYNTRAEPPATLATADQSHPARRLRPRPPPWRPIQPDRGTRPIRSTRCAPEWRDGRAGAARRRTAGRAVAAQCGCRSHGVLQQVAPCGPDCGLQSTPLVASIAASDQDACLPRRTSARARGTVRSAGTYGQAVFFASVAAAAAAPCVWRPAHGEAGGALPTLATDQLRTRWRTMRRRPGMCEMRVCGAQSKLPLALRGGTRAKRATVTATATRPRPT